VKKHGISFEVIIFVFILVAIALFLYPFFLPPQVVSDDFPVGDDPIQTDLPPVTQTDPEEETQAQADYSPCLSMESLMEKNFCIREKAISFKDVSGCELSEPSFIDGCVKAFALEFSDETICENIPDGSIKWECYSEIGKKLDHESVCLKIPPTISNNIYRGICLKDVAIASKDASICTKINYFFYEGENVKDSCIESLIYNISDENICLSVSDSDLKDDCLLQAALKTKNLDVCNLISSEGKLNECVENLENYLPAKSCEELNSETEKSECLMNRAIENEDSSICESIANFDIQGNCFSSIAVSQTNSSLCEKILASKISLRDDCFKSIALETEDSGLCENIQSSAKYLSCFSSIALSLEEVSVCNYPVKEVISSYSNYKINELCIKEFALTINDLTYCGRITNSDLKSACLDTNSSFK